MRKIKENSLYLIITEEYGCGRDALAIAEKAVAGGVDIIQMREKHKMRHELIRLGKALAGLCRKSGTIFIVNDDPILAKALDADGVHLGQEDTRLFTISEAREILGKGRIIGLSTSSPAEVKAANGTDVDYVAFGPVFHTKVKEKCVGTKDVKKVLKASRKQVFFIGGITLSNLDELLAKGAHNVAVIRAVSEAGDIADAVRKFKKRLKRRIP